MKERKLRSGVNWKVVLKQKGVKQMGIKEGCVCTLSKVDLEM
jgi:hypothetical protein